jgi:hypothetical protein
MAKSQNDWPALQAGSPLLHKWIIPTKDGNVEVYLRNGSAGFVLVHDALWYSEKIEPLVGKIRDDWGWFYRPIRGENAGLSNHASGTALDLNATKHVLGRVGTLAKSAQLRAHLLYYRGVVRWGGDYHGRKDEMHHEINRDLAAAEKVARKLMKTPRGKRILRANPGQRAVILS